MIHSNTVILMMHLQCAGHTVNAAVRVQTCYICCMLHASAQPGKAATLANTHWELQIEGVP